MKKAVKIGIGVIVAIFFLGAVGLSCIMVFSMGLAGFAAKQYIEELPDSVWDTGGAILLLDTLGEHVIQDFKANCQLPAELPPTGDPVASCGNVKLPVDYSGWKIKYFEHVKTSTHVFSGAYDEEGQLVLKASAYPVCDGKLSEVVLTISFDKEKCEAKRVSPVSLQ